MALDIIPKPLYPLVPNVPGVPALLRGGAAVVATLTGGLINPNPALDELFGADPVLWGIFESLTGNTLVIADSIVSFDYRNASRLADYPQEAGAFASYNKVNNPFDIKIRMTRSGSASDRALFIAALDAAADSLTLYDVRTPEKQFKNVNIEGWDYRREGTNGAYIIIADVNLREIRQTATSGYSQAPQSPSASDPKAQGQVQADPVTAASDTAIKGAAKQLSAVKSGGAGVLALPGFTPVGSATVSGSSGVPTITPANTGGSNGSWPAPLVRGIVSGTGGAFRGTGTTGTW